MGGIDLLAEAQAGGLVVKADGDRLVIEGPKRAAAVAQKLLQHKAEVLLALATAKRAVQRQRVVLTTPRAAKQQLPRPQARVDSRPVVLTAARGSAGTPSTVISPEYRYGPRSRLLPGDHFRASAGPFYVLSDGQKIPMGEKGTLVFRQYCERGTDHWIEAYRADGGGVAILTVGEQRASPVDPSFQRRPYRVRKIINRG